MRYGFRAAMVLELGILASDISYILLAWFGLGSFMLDPIFQYWMGIIGGILIFVFSISILTSKKNPLENEPEPLKASNAIGLVLKSFLLNSSNPSVIVFWFTTVGLAMKSYHGDSHSVFLYFASCLGTATVLDMVKAYYSKKARQLVNPKSYKWIRLFSGVLLMVLACLLIGKSVKG
jgi:threonine/homoserine/homoserine lactone efflux protein